jgi:hypothetical protein
VPSPPPARTRSQALLLRLSRLPRLVVPAAVLALTLAGLTAPPLVGALCLLLVAAFLAWLASLAWSAVAPGGRMLRTLTVGLLVGAAVARGVGAL